MAQIFAGGMEIERRIYVELTGISSEVEGSVTSSIPPGFPLDRSFARLTTNIVWDYAAYYPYISLERTGAEELTWHYHFPDPYNMEDYSPMVFTAEVILFSSPPKSIQQVSQAIDYTVNGSQVLVSSLNPAVDPTRSMAFLNSRVKTNHIGYQTTSPQVTGANDLTWKVVSYNGAVSRIMWSVVIDPN
jgi:hypothetical protein